MNLIIPFDVELIKPPDMMREQCPVAVWPKICDFDYAGHKGIWTVVGVMDNDIIYGTHYLVVQNGRISEYVPKVICQAVRVGRVFTCPICGGMGYLSCPLPAGMTAETTSWRKDCHGCGGKGWIYV